MAECTLTLFSRSGIRVWPPVASQNFDTCLKTWGGPENRMVRLMHFPRNALASINFRVARWDVVNARLFIIASSGSCIIYSYGRRGRRAAFNRWLLRHLRRANGLLIHLRSGRGDFSRRKFRSDGTLFYQPSLSCFRRIYKFCKTTSDFGPLLARRYPNHRSPPVQNHSSERVAAIGNNSDLPYLATKGPFGDC
jgi:hypothetical protein